MESSPQLALAKVAVVILADDLIWASRLKVAVERADGRPTMARSLADLDDALEAMPDGRVIVDLSSRAYDGVAAVRAAAGGGAHVIAVSQHDDLELRRAALDAGARRVYSYNKLFSDGPATIARWLTDTL